MTKNFTSLFSKILVILAIFALVLSPVGISNVAAQSAATYITSNDQLPEKGQLVIPANVGWRAPASLHGLVVTLWYGGKDDNTSTMLHLSDGLAADRALKYGDSKESYKTVIWDGDRAPISDGQNCRPDFYSDSVVLTEGVVYGDRCPIVIEYHIEHFVPAIANATATAMAPTATATPVAPAATATNPPAVGTPTALPVVPTEQVIAPPTGGMPVQVTVDPNMMAFAVSLGWMFLFCGVPLMVLGLLLYALFRAFGKPKPVTVVKE